MPVTLGLVLSAVVCAVVTVPCSIVLFRAVRAGLPSAVALLAGASVASSVLGTAVAALRSDPVPVLSIGYCLSAVLMTAAVLAVPDVAATAGARVRRLTDGLIVASCVLYAGWVVVAEPLHRAYLDGPVPFVLTYRCLVVALPTVLAVCAGGIAGAAATRAVRPRTAPARMAAGVNLAGAGSVIMIMSVYRDAGGFAVLAAGPVLAAGLYALICGARRTLRASGPRTGPAPGEHELFVTPVWLAFIASVAGLVLFEGPDRIAMMVGAFIVAALAVRQWLAGRDMQETAERLAESEAHFRTLAFTDPLTGLGNRRHLLRMLQERALGGPPCVLLSLDLDGFKNVNDIRGHDAGDAVLTEVARRLRVNVGPDDVTARLGGDEFAVLMWTPPDEAAPAAERLRDALDQPYQLPADVTEGAAGLPIFVSASIGMASCAGAADVTTLMRNADLALRFAKQQGKDRVERYDETYERWVRRRTQLADALRGAADRGELALAYQPVVALDEGGRVAGVEALLRWRHPELGQVPPDEFIPVAEETGIIAGLGAYVLEEAGRRLAGWLADGHDVWLAVNVSVHELHLPGYAERVAGTLRRHGLPRGRLVLELTEQAAAADIGRVAQLLGELREAGVRIALDDFGAGYSSLGQLRVLPADILKIDRALLDPGTRSGAGLLPTAPIVDLVVRLGHRLGLDVVAEGVTVEEQRQLLRAAGCRYAQGLLFGGPVPPDEVVLRFDPPDELAQMLGSVDSAHEMRQS